MPALVVDLTSPDRLFRGLAQHRCGQPTGPVGRATGDAPPGHAARAGASDDCPIVTVHDAASHHLAWLGGVFGAPVVPVGVDEFGQSGSIPDLYGLFDLLPDQLVNAALVGPRVDLP